MWRTALPGRRDGCALPYLTLAAARAVAPPAKSSTSPASRARFTVLCSVGGPATQIGDDTSPIEWRSVARWVLDRQHGELGCAAHSPFEPVVDLTCDGLPLLVEGGIA